MYGTLDTFAPVSVWTSLVVQAVKSLPAMQETQIQSPGWEDPLEKGMATHSSILAWRIPWTENPGGLQSMGSQKWGMTNTFTFFTAQKKIQQDTVNRYSFGFGFEGGKW